MRAVRRLADEDDARVADCRDQGLKASAAIAEPLRGGTDGVHRIGRHELLRPRDELQSECPPARVFVRRRASDPGLHALDGENRAAAGGLNWSS
jgi:hypothetical protein